MPKKMENLIFNGGRRDLKVENHRSLSRRMKSTLLKMMLAVIIDLVFISGFSPTAPWLILCLDDGLVACPSCGMRMKEENVFSHLDTCNGENNTSHAPGVEKVAATRSAPSNVNAWKLPR